MLPLPLWMERMADLVEDEIKARMQGEWPITRIQLHYVVECYRCIVDFLPVLPKAGLFIDEVLLVRDRGNEIRVLRTAMHELAERLIVVGHFPEIRSESDANLPHKIADIVADRYARFLRFVFAAREDALFRKAQAEAMRQNPVETIYVQDEWAEPPTARHTPSGGAKRRKR